MVKMKSRYLSDFQTECVHESGAVIMTDAPKDIGGEGKNFSPTDLFAVGLASCMITTMVMAAKKLGVDLAGATIEVDKEMSTSAPRRIAKLIVRFRCSKEPGTTIREKLEQAARDCPVHHSLHPDTRIEADFVWGL